MRYLLGCFLMMGVGAQTYEVRAVMGGGQRGDGGPAAEALLDGPWGLAEDADGNLYVAESNKGVIRRIRVDGTIERFAGTGSLQDGAEGRRALDTDLIRPTALLATPDGGLVFADMGACRIRKVEATGVVKNIAGTGRCAGATGGFPGFGGGGGGRDRLALETEVSSVGAMVLDAEGLLVFSDVTGNRVRRIGADGYIRTIVGTGAGGFGGDDGAAISATLQAPDGLAYDGDGNLYIADGSNCRIRRVDVNTAVSTVAGTTRCSTSGLTFPLSGATKLNLGVLSGLAWDAEGRALVVAIPGQKRVARMDLDAATIGPLAGTGRVGSEEEDVNAPTAVLWSARWGVVFTASNSFRVWQVKDGTARVLAGRWPQLESYLDAASTPLLDPRGMCRMGNGDLVVADGAAERILVLREPDAVTAVAGRRYPTGYTSVDGTEALAGSLSGLNRVGCAPDGTPFFLDSSRVRAVGADGKFRSVWTGLSGPGGIAVDEAGRIFVSETDAHQIRRIDYYAGTSTVIAGKGTVGFSGDGGAATSAQLDTPTEVALDRRGNVYFFDKGNRRVRRIGIDGVIRTVAGSRREFGYDDITGRTATDIGLGTVNGLAADPAGNLFLAESTRVTRVDVNGKIQVVWGFMGEDDNGAGTYRLGPINGADAVAWTPEGPVISMRQEGRIVRLVPEK